MGRYCTHDWLHHDSCPYCNDENHKAWERARQQKEMQDQEEFNRRMDNWIKSRNK